MTSLKTLVPAYAYPADGETQWASLRTLGDDSGLVVVNPHNGAGDAVDLKYQSVVDNLRQNKVQLLGYVNLDFGLRGMTSILTDIAKYREWYAITGIFFDQFPSVYRTRVASVLSLARRCGVNYVVANCGVVLREKYDEQIEVVCEFEGTYDAYVARAKELNHFGASHEIAHLVFNVAPQLQAHVRALATRSGATILAMSPDGETNPWGTFVLTNGSEDDVETSPCPSQSSLQT